MKIDVRIKLNKCSTIWHIVLLVLIIVLLKFSSVYAQCPTDIQPTPGSPNYVPWLIKTIVVLDPYSNCVDSTTYCYRVIQDFPCIVDTCYTIQRYVSNVHTRNKNSSEGFNPLLGPCNSLDSLNVINRALDTVWRIPHDTTIPCDNKVYAYLTLYSSACWRIADHDILTGKTWYRPCSSSNTPRCVQKCRICQGSVTQVSRFDCTWQQLGQGDCSSCPFDPPCYHVTCGSRP